MIEDSPLERIIIFAIIVLIDACCYGFGAAIQALNKAELEENSKQGNKKARLLEKLTEKPEPLVNTMQVIVKAINILAGCILIRSFTDMIAALYIVLTFGVLVPKKLAVKYNHMFAYGLVYIANVFIIILTPITYIISFTAKIILLIFGIDPNEKKEDVTEEEIISMVNEVQEQGGILDSEAEMISNIFELGEKDAKDIMTHRTAIVFMDCNLSLSDALEFGLNQDYSRFPVYEEDIDNILGIVNLKDLMIKYNEGKESRNTSIKYIRGLIRQTSFIPQTRDANILFKSMQSEHMHMVVVVDEYGQTSGIVTMEDILEEIVGNIIDEYDHEEALIVEQKNGRYLINGMAELEDVEETLGIEFEEDDCDTLNGFIMSQLDKIPSEDEKICIQYAGYEFNVLSMDNKIIRMVSVRKVTADTISMQNPVTT